MSIYQSWHQILLLEIAQRLAEYCQIGEISPYLVTLFALKNQNGTSLIYLYSKRCEMT